MDNFTHYEQAIEQVGVRMFEQRHIPFFCLCCMWLFSLFCPHCVILLLFSLSLSYTYSCLQAVWVKKGSMQWWRDWKPHKWIDVTFALEQFSGPEGNKDGILFIYYNFYEEKKVI